MQSGWNKLFPSEVMDCVSAGLGRRDLEQIIFCCYHSNPTQGTLWGCDRASLSISSWFTNAGWSATAPAAQCSAFPLLQGSSSLGCVFFSQKIALGQAKSKFVSWEWLSKDRGLTSSLLFITSIVPWHIPEWAGNCSELQITHVFQCLLLNTRCYIQVLQNNCCHQEHLLQWSTFLLIYLEREVRRDISPAGDEICQDFAYKPFNHTP